MPSRWFAHTAAHQYAWWLRGERRRTTLTASGSRSSSRISSGDVFERVSVLWDSVDKQGAT